MTVPDKTGSNVASGEIGDIAKVNVAATSRGVPASSDVLASSDVPADVPQSSGAPPVNASGLTTNAAVGKAVSQTLSPPVEVNPPEPVAVGSAVVLADAAIEDSQWYVRSDSGEQFGPANSQLFDTWIQEGRVPKNALVWKQGWPNWKPACEVPECRTNSNSLEMPPLQDSNRVAAESEPPAVLSNSSASVAALEVDIKVGRAQEEFTPPAGAIRIETSRPPTRRVNRTPAVVILLCVACLLLAIPLVYVFLSSN